MLRILFSILAQLVSIALHALPNFNYMDFVLALMLRILQVL